MIFLKILFPQGLKLDLVLLRGVVNLFVPLLARVSVSFIALVLFGNQVQVLVSIWKISRAADTRAM